MIWLYAILGLFVLLVLAFAVHVWRMQRALHRVQAAVVALRVEDIPRLAKECQDAFADLHGIDLSLENLEESAMAIDITVWLSRRLRRELATPGESWMFALPVGAFLGQLLLAHGRGEWKRNANGLLCVNLRHRRATVTMNPFSSALKHVAIGQRGDLFATVMVAAGKGEEQRVKIHDQG